MPPWKHKSSLLAYGYRGTKLAQYTQWYGYPLEWLYQLLCSPFHLSGTWNLEHLWEITAVPW